MAILASKRHSKLPGGGGGGGVVYSSEDLKIQSLV